jgi:hypothetical protein
MVLIIVCSNSVSSAATRLLTSKQCVPTTQHAPSTSSLPAKNMEMSRTDKIVYMKLKAKAKRHESIQPMDAVYVRVLYEDKLDVIILSKVIQTITMFYILILELVCGSSCYSHLCDDEHCKFQRKGITFKIDL